MEPATEDSHEAIPLTAIRTRPSLIPFAGLAQSNWPSRPIRVVVPFAPGTVTDVVPRLVFEQVSAQLGQSIVVENRPGAGGTTAAGIIAKADADGTTSWSTRPPIPSLRRSTRTSAMTRRRTSRPLLPLGIVPNVLVVSQARGFKTVADFVAAAKAKAGGMSFGSAGVGTATHLSAMRFLASAGFEAVHIPFKGGPEALSEIIAGRLDFFFARSRTRCRL